MWYRKSNDFMSGIIPIKGAENAPLINGNESSSNDNSNENDPYNGETLENALNKSRNPSEESIFQANSSDYVVHKGGLSAIIEDSYALGPGTVSPNKPATLYSV